MVSSQASPVKYFEYHLNTLRRKGLASEIPGYSKGLHVMVLHGRSLPNYLSFPCLFCCISSCPSLDTSPPICISEMSSIVHAGVRLRAERAGGQLKP